MQPKSNCIAAITHANIAKTIFVLLCCTAVANFIMHSSMGRNEDGFPGLLKPDFRAFSWAWLGAILVLSRGLSFKGKYSASWAVLAFGSLTATLVLTLLTVLWYLSDTWQGSFMGLLVVSVSTIAVIYCGLQTALKGAWKQMGAFVLGGLFLMVILLPFMYYGQYFYCQRKHLGTWHSYPPSSVKDTDRKP